MSPVGGKYGSEDGQPDNIDMEPDDAEGNNFLVKFSSTSIFDCLSLL